MKELLIKSLQDERNNLASMLIIQDNNACTKQNQLIGKYTKQISELTDALSKIKRRIADSEMLGEQNTLLMSQQKQALKTQLVRLDVDLNKLKMKLDKELKLKQSKEHEIQQKLKNEQNLNSAKQSNVEKLFEELETKDIELRNLHILTERSSKMQSLNDFKIKRELTNLKKNLAQERNLKLEAFQRVDNLQCQVYDLEDELTNTVTAPASRAASRPQTSIVKMRSMRANLSSAQSGGGGSSAGVANKYSSPFPRLTSMSSNLLLQSSMPAAAANENDIHHQQQQQQLAAEGLGMIKSTTSLNLKASTGLLQSRPKTVRLTQK
jgi:DNA repair exonuclease SbcCD ATPase subunit